MHFLHQEEGRLNVMKAQNYERWIFISTLLMSKDILITIFCCWADSGVIWITYMSCKYKGIRKWKAVKDKVVKSEKL